jgi:[ribosomal protein S5]-alanine N-acetyltransferase
MNFSNTHLPIPSPYFLQSERLGFRHWSSDDVPLGMGLWGDADVTKLIGWPFSETQVRDRLSQEIERQEKHHIQYWPIFLLTSGEHVGCCGLRPYDLTPPIYEIGFHIRKVFWGQRYGFEAAQAVIAYAFDTLGAKGLFAGHNPANEASGRLLGKLGFQYTHDEYYPPTGLNHPSYLLMRPAK